MKIVEGKQAVLQPYRTEKECVRPKRGQTVLPLEPVACPVRKLSTAICSSVRLSDAREIIRHTETQVPKDCVLQTVSEIEMHKPVECPSQEIPDIVVQSVTESASHIDDITIKNLQTTAAQVISATPELERMMQETESGMSRMKKKRWFADTILRITNTK